MSDPTCKCCSVCGEVKPLEEFPRRSDASDGRRSRCKTCTQTYKAEHYKANRDKILADQAEYRDERRDEFRARNTRYYEAHKDEIRERGAEYNEAHKDEIREYNAKYRAAHAAELKSKKAKYQAEHKDRGRTANAKYDKANPLRKIWVGMLQRCENPAHKYYKNYGGRGIAVCPEWHDYSTFTAWVEANLGPRPEGHSLDRVNNDLGYCPENLRWASAAEQARNRRKPKKPKP